MTKRKENSCEPKNESIATRKDESRRDETTWFWEGSLQEREKRRKELKGKGKKGEDTCVERERTMKHKRDGGTKNEKRRRVYSIFWRMIAVLVGM